MCFVVQKGSMDLNILTQAKQLGLSFLVKLNLCLISKDTVVVFQSQGAITEKLRSFSMHDLTTIQGDEPVGQRPYQTLPEAKKKTRASASESSGMYLFSPLPKRAIHPKQKWKSRHTFTLLLNGKGLKEFQST